MRNGTLRRADPELLASEFIGALLLWRLMQAIGSDFAIVRDPEAFARQHVEHFLNGAGRTESRRSARPQARSARNKQVAGSVRSRIRRNDSTEAEDV
jgi:hypothetical protein